ncbi:hypothetical protein TNCV_5055451 [Trichonephila clavipes]|nr:hypothetical protein TNCV_5055451 [Trichonephila clavipes]
MNLSTSDVSHPPGCGSPGGKVSGRGRHVTSSEPSTTGDPPRRAALKRPPVGVVRQLGGGRQLRCRPRHLDRGSEITWSVAKSPPADEQCKVNIHSGPSDILPAYYYTQLSSEIQSALLSKHIASIR